MNKLKDLIINRRSKRQYNDQAIDDALLNDMIEAGLLAPTGRNLHPNDLIVVRDKAMLEHLSRAKTSGAGMLKDADAAIVVTGDPQKSDTWIEDGAIAMSYMQLMAEYLGVGNCWVQIRNRISQDVQDEVAVPANDYVRYALDVPVEIDVLAILALGMSDEVRAPHTDADLDFSKCHSERFSAVDNH